MSLSDKLSYLFDSIRLLSQIIATMISTVKCEGNSLPSTIEDILKGESNWNRYEIIPPCYAINTCILYRLCFERHGFLLEDLIGCTDTNFHHATTFGARNITFQIWWLPCTHVPILTWPVYYVICYVTCVAKLHVATFSLKFVSCAIIWYQNILLQTSMGKFKR